MQLRAFPCSVFFTVEVISVQARAERIRELKALGGLGTCGCCFDDELLPEEGR